DRQVVTAIVLQYQRATQPADGSTDCEAAWSRVVVVVMAVAAATCERRDGQSRNEQRDRAEHPRDGRPTDAILGRGLRPDIVVLRSRCHPFIWLHSKRSSLVSSPVWPLRAPRHSQALPYVTGGQDANAARQFWLTEGRVVGLAGIAQSAHGCSRSQAIEWALHQVCTLGWAGWRLRVSGAPRRIS